jgi:hypothetical protein
MAAGAAAAELTGAAAAEVAGAAAAEVAGAAAADVVAGAAADEGAAVDFLELLHPAASVTSATANVTALRRRAREPWIILISSVVVVQG